MQLLQLLQEDHYNEPEINLPSIGDHIPSQPFDLEDELSDAVASGTLEPSPEVQVPPVASFLPPVIDDSEILEHKRTPFVETSKFKFGFALWCIEAGISVRHYSTILELLNMARGNMPEELAKLPSSLSTLKRWFRGQLPLLTMRKKRIPLEAGMLGQDRRVGSSGASVAAGRSEEDLYFFDPVHLSRALMGSDITRKMHVGFGEFHDKPTELWHGHGWRSSIRTTAGNFSHYSDGKPIFPSDIITFHCDDHLNCENLHLGRVYSVGRDYRSSALEHGRTTIEVQEIIRPEILSQIEIGSLSSPVLPHEAMLSWNAFHYVSENQVRAKQTNVVLDYYFEDRNISPRPAPTIQPEHILIRRVFDLLDASSGEFNITPLCKYHPLRGELELQAFGRDHLEAFDSTLTGRKTVSLPWMTFIDAFGLYRNRRRSLMGMYLIPASLPFSERQRRANVFPLTLGPHGSNFSDVIGALKSLITLDRGAIVDIHGEEVLLCAFTHAYIGDMPQQQVNSGMKSQNANLGCRFCYINADERGDVDFDHHLNGRYHHQVVAMREDMETIRTKGQKEKYCKKWGMSLEPPALAQISPALDILLSRPGDPAHSEYKGLSNLMHSLLLDSVLTTSATRSYAALLRSFPFPPTWPRVQGPLRYLKSYSLSEHARWSVVIPVLLRCWLRESYIQPWLLGILSADGQDPVGRIVSCFAAAAASNCVLMGNTMTAEDRGQLDDIIGRHRSKVQQLLQDAADSATQNPRRHRSRESTIGPLSQAPSRAATPAFLEHDPAGHGEGLFGAFHSQPPRELAKKALNFLNDIKRPNMHTALHYSILNEEYALPVNHNALPGEDKHKWFKLIVYYTNHTQVEKRLLERENDRQTLRFLLTNEFCDTELDIQLTNLVQSLYVTAQFCSQQSFQAPSRWPVMKSMMTMKMKRLLLTMNATSVLLSLGVFGQNIVGTKDFLLVDST